MKILLVDDEEIILELLKEDIEESFPGASVICACDGVEGLEFYHREEDFSLVITDIKMPRMDGLELVANLNQLNNPPPVIIVSGHVDVNAKLDYKNSYSILLKPYEFKKLEQLISSYMASGSGQNL